MPRSNALLVVLVLTLAGCAAAPGSAPPPADDADASPTGALREPVLLDECTEMATDFAVPLSELAERLPDGFAPDPIAGDAGLLEVIFLRCASDAATGEEGVFASLVWTTVVPPDEWRAEGVSFFFYVFALTTADEGVARALVDVGAPATLAPTSYAHALGEGVASRGTVEAEGWSMTLETLVPPRDTQRGHPIVRVFVADESGAVTHALDVDPGSHPHQEPGTGRLVVTGDAPFPAPQAPGLAVLGSGGHFGFTYVPYGMMGEPPVDEETEGARR